MTESAVESAPPPRAVGTVSASLGLALWLLVATNASFWSRLWRVVSPADAADLLLVAALGLMLLAVWWMLLSWLSWPRLLRPAWLLLLASATAAAYFMDTYGLVIDRVAIQSVFETDSGEISEWVSWRMLPYVALFLGPAWVIGRMPLRFAAWPREVAARVVLAAAAAATLAAGLTLMFQPVASLARNHRELARLLNPSAVVAATWGYARRAWHPDAQPRAVVGGDARLGASWRDEARRRLVVVVVGESARASSFGVLGYGRDTTPRLAANGVVAFTDVRSCGTSTAVSLPCMFSGLRRADYSEGAGRRRETLLDVIAHAGLRVLWLDNNTGSKTVAARQEEVSLAERRDPGLCNAAGCFDEVLVAALRERIASRDPPSVVVLHQKGSHGPSYFERYPPAFRRFTPTCESNELGDCTAAQIRNTYDNTILYTDHVLSEVIGLLEERADTFDSAMLYVSDHGESTGEHGLFLHGAPDFMAPAEQTHVPMLLWTSPRFDRATGLQRSCIARRAAKPWSHDHFFHTVLGLLDIRTGAYAPALDVADGCRASPRDT